MTNIASYLLANAYSGLAPINQISAIVDSKPELWSNIAVTAIWIVLVVFIIAAMWRVFVKAGQAGWAAIIPVYNLIVLLRIIGKPLWWIVLMFIPFVSIVASFLIAHNTSRVFGKGIGFTLGLIFLPFIFYPILGFGSATYIPPTQANPVQ